MFNRIINWKAFIRRFLPAFIILNICLSNAVFSKPLDKHSRETIAQKLVQALLDRQYSAARKFFTKKLADALPEKRIKRIWEDKTESAGGFKKILRYRHTKYQKFYIVFVTCEFEKKTFDIKVVFSPDGRVSGLWFRPAIPPWEPPSYAKQGIFKEIEVTVGRPPWKLPGTLTVPKGKGPFPAIVLVHGS
jgi:hypothetical protein